MGYTHNLEGEFLRSTFSFIDGQDNVYSGQAPIRVGLLSSEDFRKSLKRVPDENVYPKPPAEITIVSIEAMGNVYIKRPKLVSYEELVGEELGRKDLVAEMLLEEVKTLEFLMRNPHPNFVRYHGCIVRRDRITGLVLDRYPITLADRVKEGAQGFKKGSWVEAIESGVKHLHSLGLAHNDLNPANIMFNEDDNPIIIDFGSCKPFGESLISAGTPGWIDEEFTTSEQRHDEIALGKIRTWLEEK
ncbi:hypothetical protein AOQ84DRAFT_291322 [Glonium stellatum]|uniref:Protein kinase domain-containing protein n=1 Tax=Glonium stellatum TaxID=574774 RepID=A0A8E2JUA5_9PEZI|nr:hypothetical protein AOQ84DRAFT_291322 [Glonium stellatum]